MLQIFDTGVSLAEENMRFDERLLENLDPKGDPILHLYQWERPSATFGYFIQPESHFDLQKVKEVGLDLARRPTGGGIVFHIWDLAFSFLMPSEHPHFHLSTLENYQFVNRAVLKAVKSHFSLIAELTEEDFVASSDCRHFCMARPTRYDVVYQGMKIAGAAQRRRRQGYLHQGTISLSRPDLRLLGDLLSNTEVLQAMASFAFTPVPDSDLPETRIHLQKLLAAKLQEALEF